MKKAAFFVLAFVCFAMIASCGDSGSNLSAKTTIIILPEEIGISTIKQGETKKFSAAVLHNLLPYDGDIEWGIRPESAYDSGAKFEPKTTKTGENTKFTAPTFVPAITEPYEMHITATAKGTTAKYKLKIKP